MNSPMRLNFTHPIQKAVLRTSNAFSNNLQEVFKMQASVQNAPKEFTCYRNPESHAAGRKILEYCKQQCIDYNFCLIDKCNSKLRRTVLNLKVKAFNDN